MSEDYKIPQNIDVEDKIFGPFTLKQFLYILFGGIAVYFLFLTVGSIDLTLFVIASVPVALLVLALVFIKINERPFVAFLGYFFVYTANPKLLLWKKSVHIKSLMVQSAEETQQSKNTVASSAKTGVLTSRLSQLVSIVDNQGWSIGAEVVEGGGRVVAVSEKTAAKRDEAKFEEKRGDDMFGDLEEAFEGVAEESSQVSADEDFSDLAANLSRLLSQK